VVGKISGMDSSGLEKKKKLINIGPEMISFWVIKIFVIQNFVSFLVLKVLLQASTMFFKFGAQWDDELRLVLWQEVDILNIPFNCPKS